ncbi:MAG: hypothetical protein LBT52_02000 [Clostridiales Family XIII bacterium]|jgi:hypothetical protein|nr:hypothetical protein [Clostridiales Family XIII bacterium]
MKIEFKSTIRNIAVIMGAAVIASLILMSYETGVFFSAGLACGTGAAIAGFALTYLSTERAVRSGRAGSAFVVIGLKLIIYLGVMFIMTVTLGLWAGVGAAAGCFIGPIAIIAAGVVVPGIRGKVNAARGVAEAGSDVSREYIYEEHIRARDGSLRYVFMRGAYWQCYTGGRSYVTHRRFRKLKEIRVKNALGDDRDRRVSAHG